MTMLRPLGVIAAIPTPIKADGWPDESRFINLAHDLLAKGCDGLNVLGTTGEATSLSVKQRFSLMSAVAQSGLPCSQFLVGTGAAALADAQQLTFHAAELGFGGALLLPPFYYKGISDDGLLRFVEGVAKTSEIPVYLYNFPALSGVTFGLSFIEAALQHFGKRIAGLKDSSGDMNYASAAAALSANFDVFPSTEAALIEAAEGRYAGCISATANINAHLCRLAFHNKDRAALNQAVSIRNALSGLPMVPAVKHVLAWIRKEPELQKSLPPLMELSRQQIASLRGSLAPLLDRSESA